MSGKPRSVTETWGKTTTSQEYLEKLGKVEKHEKKAERDPERTNKKKS